MVFRIRKRRKQNHKISFHFFAAPPCTPRLLNGLVRKFLVLYARLEGACEARTVRITTQSERTRKYKATTRSARAELIKILRIFFVKSSNFVQKTPQMQTPKLSLWCLCILRESVGFERRSRGPFGPASRVPRHLLVYD